MAQTPFSGVDQFLREVFGSDMRQEDLADFIGEKQGRYSSYLRGTQNLGAKTIYRYLKNIYDLGIIEGRKQNAQNFFKAIATIHNYDNAKIWKKLIAGKTDNSKASNLSNYQNGKVTISQQQFKNLLGNHSSKIFKPIIEFMECSPCRTSQKPNASWQLFENDSDKEEYVKNKLYDDEEHNIPKLGVYAMYDSSGRILYFGMAQSANHGLYKEILQRLKARVHRDVVLICNGKLKHLGATQATKQKSDEILVGDMTRYFSAIEVSVPQAIPNIEAFVLRLIPNDTVNYKVENIKQ